MLHRCLVIGSLAYFKIFKGILLTPDRIFLLDLYWLWLFIILIIKLNVTFKESILLMNWVLNTFTKVNLVEFGQPRSAEIRPVESLITKQWKVVKSQENLTISQYF